MSNTYKTLIVLQLMFAATLLGIAAWQSDPVYAAIAIAPAAGILPLVDEARRRKGRVACQTAR